MQNGSPKPNSPSPDDALRIAIVGRISALLPTMSPELRHEAMKLLMQRDVATITHERGYAFAASYCVENMFFSLKTFAAAFDAAFCGDRIAATTEMMRAGWREAERRIDREQRQVDHVLGGYSMAELAKLRDAIAAAIAARPVAAKTKREAEEQRDLNQYEAGVLRRSNPAVHGVARSWVFDVVQLQGEGERSVAECVAELDRRHADADEARRRQQRASA
jgi:hypothetical protein